MSWKLTLVMLSGLPLIIPILSFLSSRLQPNIEGQQVEMSKAAKHVFNAITSIETVKCFGGQNTEFERYAATLRQATAFYYRQVFWFATQVGVTRMATMSMYVQAFWFGSSLLNKGEISAENIVIAFLGTTMAMGAVMQVIPQLLILEKGKAAGQKLRAVMVQKSKKQHHRECERAVSDACIGDIEFREVRVYICIVPELC
jgi:ATP-binding cassette subfamily B (MDR/TAP) protein 1